jgi:hypothetical protein
VAKIGALPSKAIISGFYGVIDYYVRDGQAIVRKWPRRHAPVSAPLQMAQWPIFAASTRLWTALSAEQQQLYNEMASGSTLSGRDLASKLYLNAKFIYPGIGTYAYSSGG